MYCLTNGPFLFAGGLRAADQMSKMNQMKASVERSIENRVRDGWGLVRTNFCHQSLVSGLKLEKPAPVLS